MMPRGIRPPLHGALHLLYAGVFVGAAAVPAAGQITGRVEGTVVDRSTGEPLVGGLVIVEATNLGNVTRSDGSFFINDVPVGHHRIVSEYLGYRTLSQGRRILAGETAGVEFRMAADVVQADGIAAVIEREPLRPPPPERLYIRTAPPGEGIEAAQGYGCAAQAVLHGSYIRNGRWELQYSVKDLACRIEPAERAPESQQGEALEGVVIHVSPLRSEARYE
jgi:hypothetical protein